MEVYNNIMAGNMGLVEMAVLFVVALIALLILFWLFSKIFGSKTSRLNKSRQPRLSVTDAAVVDDKRRLVLVRRDNVEHLLMIGGPSDIVVEQNIGGAAAAASAGTSHAVPAHSPSTASRLEPEARTVAAPAPKAAPAPETPRATEIKESAPSVSERVASTATAAGAGVAAVAANSGSSLSGLAKNTGDQLSETVSRSLEGAADVASNSVANAADSIDAAVESVEAGTSDLGDALSENLQQTFAQKEEPVVEEPTSSAAPEVSSTDSDNSQTPSKTEDEMQRLLDELSSAKN